MVKLFITIVLAVALVLPSALQAAVPHGMPGMDHGSAHQGDVHAADQFANAPCDQTAASDAPASDHSEHAAGLICCFVSAGHCGPLALTALSDDWRRIFNLLSASILMGSEALPAGLSFEADPPPPRG